MRTRVVLGVWLGVLVLAGTAAANEQCGHDGAAARDATARGQEEAPQALTVVVPGAPGGAPSEAVVSGGPSRSVRVLAPPSVSATATGGHGAPGLPGPSAHPPSQDPLE
jgi:hypothetical protein